MASAEKVTEHDHIKHWVEERKGCPATVRGTGGEEEAGILRIDFPGGAGEEKLEHISWDEWFAKFDENHLAVLLQEQTSGGKTSHFIKLVNR